MVYVALLLLTVSTLAVHGKPTGADCIKIGEWTYCTKPLGYPQAEIDQSIAETNKNSLNPLNMGANLIKKRELEHWSVEGNCDMEIIPNFTPYTMTKGNDTKFIVQSEFFNQHITAVKCSEKNKIDAMNKQKGDDKRYYECFKDFIPGGSNFNTTCVQRTITIKLYIYIGNTIGGRIGEMDAPIDSDCICAQKRILED